jgi:hypothetical protein
MQLGENLYSVLPGCGTVWSDKGAQNFGRVEEVNYTKCFTILLPHYTTSLGLPGRRQYG